VNFQKKQSLRQLKSSNAIIIVTASFHREVAGQGPEHVLFKTAHITRRIMGKNFEKIKKALEIRQANMPKGAGYKKPGSMNKKKTGYAKLSK
jgi:hypothetical protein